MRSGKSKPMAKAAPAHREQLALDLLLTGKSATATVAHMAAHCGCSRRQADIDACNIDRPAQVAKLIHVLETTCEQALLLKQFNAVVASCRELRELLGLAADR